MVMPTSRPWARVLAPLALAFWLALDTVGPRPVRLAASPVVADHRADPEGRRRTEGAIRAFGDLLAISQNAATRNSHWRVTLASWRDAQTVWDHVSVTLPAPAQGLIGCAVPLQEARGLIEQAHQEFAQAAADISGPRALDLLLAHEESQKQAEGLLHQAEDCYRAARNASLTP